MQPDRFGMLELSPGELALVQAFLGWRGTALTDVDELAAAFDANRDRLGANGDTGELVTAFMADLLCEARSRGGDNDRLPGMHQ